MSQYALPADFTALGLPAEAFASIEATTVTQALISASAVVDSYLRSRYQLPIVSSSPDLTRVTVAIAVYDLLSRRGFNPDGSDENVRLRYNDAIGWLKDVAAGRASPDLVDSTPSNSEGRGSVSSAESRGW